MIQDTPQTIQVWNSNFTCCEFDFNLIAPLNSIRKLKKSKCFNKSEIRTLIIFVPSNLTDAMAIVKTISSTPTKYLQQENSQRSSSCRNISDILKRFEPLTHKENHFPLVLLKRFSCFCKTETRISILDNESSTFHYIAR